MQPIRRGLNITVGFAALTTCKRHPSGLHLEICIGFASCDSLLFLIESWAIMEIRLDKNKVSSVALGVCRLSFLKISSYSRRKVYINHQVKLYKINDGHTMAAKEKQLRSKAHFPFRDTYIFYFPFLSPG
eukprot:TRINITY_DN9399_c0_g2_i1.p1 TRINITY_DN9399_c0_g2~~TRINITY_DN9399_c0_g2_i1.p1  ORF type:complete len:130 (-),score=6.82 TRINITY_DN9399_c0_g2_i1:82-471(-)